VERRGTMDLIPVHFVGPMAGSCGQSESLRNWTYHRLLLTTRWQTQASFAAGDPAP